MIDDRVDWTSCCNRRYGISVLEIIYPAPPGLQCPLSDLCISLRDVTTFLGSVIYNWVWCSNMMWESGSFPQREKPPFLERLSQNFEQTRLGRNRGKSAMPGNMIRPIACVTIFSKRIYLCLTSKCRDASINMRTQSLLAPSNDWRPLDSLWACQKSDDVFFIHIGDVQQENRLCSIERGWHRKASTKA